MTFLARATVALLSGIGAGTVGFWATWRFIALVLKAEPGIGHDVWLVGSIFGPGVVVAFVAFFFISRSVPAKSEAVTPRGASVV